jgi:peptidoglycan/LPS O-acetylase OafA/YrhL
MGLLAVCAACLLLAFCFSKIPFYRQQFEEAKGRYQSIDGLRGFLALGVFGEHAMSMYGLHAGGGWGDGVPEFYLRASQGGVALFFMITAFLFWGRVLKTGPAFDVRAFFTSRLRRLTPMYLCSVVMVLAVVVGASGFALRSGPAQLFHELLPWLSFGFMTTGELNGVRDAHAINAVYWTLGYEWLFYLVLPLAALFSRGAVVLVPVALLLVFGSVSPIIYCFLFGGLAAALQGKEISLKYGWIAPLALIGWFFAAPLPKLAQYALLFVFFVLIAHGWSAFGLLRSRPARMLGVASYSLYLVHCIVLYAVVSAADCVVPIASLTMVEYWTLAAAAALLAVSLSAITYRYVEFPFIHPQPISTPHRRPAWIRRAISG